VRQNVDRRLEQGREERVAQQPGWMSMVANGRPDLHLMMPSLRVFARGTEVSTEGDAFRVQSRDQHHDVGMAVYRSRRGKRAPVAMRGQRAQLAVEEMRDDIVHTPAPRQRRTSPVARLESAQQREELPPQRREKWRGVENRKRSKHVHEK
jgi:hypothetical protein